MDRCCLLSLTVVNRPLTSSLITDAAEGYKLIIGGVEIPHTKGCEAHSDGEGGYCCKLTSITVFRF